ncbi:MAG: hypothetical protein PHR77_16000, partial [Kiritimatiellae bacterium]|nr:hypothetical protein [Kiritimatiellia bacterium]
MCYRYQKLLLFLAIVITGEAAENKWPADAQWLAWTVVGKADSQVQLVGDEDAKKLLQWVIPLPKRIRLEGKLVLPASGIGPRL